MRSMDTSSIIHAWENYPISMFPHLWAWFAEEIKTKNLIFSEVVAKELRPKSDECLAWIKAQHKAGKGKFFPKTEQNIQIAERIRGDLLAGSEAAELAEEGEGVGMNDLHIIALAEVQKTVLVTNEKRQNFAHLVASNARKETYRMPAVCEGLADVVCEAWIDYLKAEEEAIISHLFS